MEEYVTVGWEDYPSVKTPITAANLKKMDDQIKSLTDEVIDLGKSKVTKLTGILSKNSTSLTFTNAAFTSTCTFEMYTDVYGVSPDDCVLTNGKLVTTWTKQSNDLNVLVKVYDEEE